MSEGVGNDNAQDKMQGLANAKTPQAEPAGFSHTYCNIVH